jgi:[ribosomal protein S5]-alanine N-acetyltransferase
MTAMPALETPRLRIRPLVFKDFEVARAVLDAGFGVEPEAERREWFEWQVRSYTALERLFQPPYGERAIELRSTGECVGLVGLVPSLGPFRRLPAYRSAREPEDTYFEPSFGLFWAVAPAHQRRGYALEAARALADFVFNALGARVIVATTEYENEASVAVMRSIGMTVERNPTPGDPPWFQVVGVLHATPIDLSYADFAV